MSVSGKPSKISSLVAVLCIFIYIVAIAFGAVQIIENIQERRNLAEKEFYDLADRASSSAVFLGFMSKAYEETINVFIGNSETLLGVIITGSDGEYAFERNQGSGISWNGDSPRFRTGAGFFGEPFLLYLRIEGQRNVTIQAIYSPIERDLTLKVLRNTLFAVLASLALALVTLLVELNTKNKTGLYRSKEAEKAQEIYEDYGTKPEIPDYEPEPEIPDYEQEPESEPEIPDYEPEPEPEIPDYEPINSGSRPDEPVPEPEEEISFEFNPEDIDINIELPSEAPEQGPQGLFSPRGNVGWESYTLHRLDSELQRCASFEQDLVFMVMGFRGKGKLSDALYRQFTNEAVNFFAMRDLIFERAEDGLSVIVPNEDLEQGISKSELFRSQIIAKLADPYEGADSPGTELCIGLSSRNGRLIEADRLMMEAGKALERAVNDPDSPIMAFKSDLEKYREYIKGHLVK